MKRIIATILTVVMVATMMPTMIWAEERIEPDPQSIGENEVWVGNVRVTEENKDNVLDDGTVQYDFETRTLTLDDASIGESDDVVKYGIVSYVDTLNIVATGESYIHASTLGVFNNGNISIGGSGKLKLYGTKSKDSKGIYSCGDTVTNKTKLQISDYENGILCHIPEEDALKDFKMNGGSLNLSSKGEGIWVNTATFTDASSVNISSPNSPGIYATEPTCDYKFGDYGDVIFDNCDSVHLYSEECEPLHVQCDVILKDCDNVAAACNGNGSAIECWYGDVSIAGCGSVELVSAGDIGIFCQNKIELTDNRNIVVHAYEDAMICDDFILDNSNLNAIANYGNSTEDECSAISYSDSCQFISGTAKLAGNPSAIYCAREVRYGDISKPVTGQGYKLQGSAEYNSFTSLSDVTYMITESTWGGDDTPVRYMHSAVGDTKAQSLQLIAVEQTDPEDNPATKVEELESKVNMLEAKNKELETKLAAPDIPALIKLKATKKKITVKWKAANGATSYQVYYRQKGKKKAKIVNVKGTSKKIKKLKKGKKYYIKVRAVKTSGNVVVYGNWTKQYSKKTKRR